MKKLFIIASILFTTLSMNAQTSKDIYSPGKYPMYWLGIDFSTLKLVDIYDQSPEKIQEVYLKSLNHLMVTERTKFSVENMFYRPTVEYTIEKTDSIIDLIEPKQLLSNKATTLSDEELEKVISAYNFSDKEQGIGVMLIAEYFNKTLQEASYVLVAINTVDNTIIFKERYLTKAVGFGFRNYWAGSIYEVFKSTKKSYYKLRKKYTE